MTMKWWDFLLQNKNSVKEEQKIHEWETRKCEETSDSLIPFHQFLLLKLVFNRKFCENFAIQSNVEVML
jgi:hypothetical protein